MAYTLVKSAALAAAVMVLAGSPAHANTMWKCYFKASNESLLSGVFVQVQANTKPEAEAKAVTEIRRNRGNNVQIQSLDCQR